MHRCHSRSVCSQTQTVELRLIWLSIIYLYLFWACCCRLLTSQSVVTVQSIFICSKINLTYNSIKAQTFNHLFIYKLHYTEFASHREKRKKHCNITKCRRIDLTSSARTVCRLTNNILAEQAINIEIILALIHIIIIDFHINEFRLNWTGYKLSISLPSIDNVDTSVYINKHTHSFYYCFQLKEL